MVTAPIVLLIAVATTPDGIAAANEAAAACLQALPSGAKTVLRTVPKAPDDADVSAAAAAAGATATVVVTWRDADHLVSDVRVRSTSPDGIVRQTERNVVFSARDQPVERGRALGLVIASILDEDWTAGARTASQAPSCPSVSGAERSIRRFPRRSAERTDCPRGRRHVGRWRRASSRRSTAGGLRRRHRRPRRGTRSLTPRWALRAGLGFRVADLDGANATARTTMGSLGAVWASQGFAEGRRVGFAVRADLLGVREVIKRDDDDDQGIAGHWTIGADLVGQLGLGLSSWTSLLFSAGLEGFVGGENLAAAGQPPVTIPRGRVIFELGVLSRFLAQPAALMVQRYSIEELPSMAAVPPHKTSAQRHHRRRCVSVGTPAAPHAMTRSWRGSDAATSMSRRTSTGASNRWWTGRFAGFWGGWTATGKTSSRLRSSSSSSRWPATAGSAPSMPGSPRSRRTSSTSTFAGGDWSGPSSPRRWTRTKRSRSARDRAASTRRRLREALRQVADHLCSMHEDRSWAFLLHDVCGYSLDEVAHICRISVVAAQSRLVRGRREIHDRIAGDPRLAKILDRGDP